MKPRAYLETSVLSHLTGRPSRDLIVAAHQQITHEWWDSCRGNYHLVVSQLVAEEAAAGDPGAAQRRLERIRDVPRLDLNDEALALAAELTEQGAVPPERAADALHIAFASAHGVRYLVTWNCAHIANAETRFRIEEVCRAFGHEPPIICTPEELLGV